MLSTFQPLAYTLDVRYAKDLSPSQILRMLIVGLLYESYVLLADVAENNIALMTAGQVGPEGALTAVLIATEVENE